MGNDTRRRKSIQRVLCVIVLGGLIYTVSDLYSNRHNYDASSLATAQAIKLPYNTVGNLSSRYRRLPSCLIIGVRKAGTRALLKFLSSHPFVQRAGKEVHYFDRFDNYRQGLEWYRSRMPPSAPGQITLEKTPAYFNEAEVPPRVFQYDPGVKLILVLRDPVTRVISDYTQTLTSHKLKGQPYPRFENFALNQQTGDIDVTYKPIQLSLYNIYVRRWLRYFPLSSIHLVCGEGLIKRPWKELKRVERFLRIPQHIIQDHFYFNSTRGFYCLKSSINSGCLSFSKGRKHPNVDPKLISKLREFYKPYNNQLIALVKRNFTWSN